VQTSGAPTPHPSSQQPDRQSRHQSSSRAPSPTLDSILFSTRRQIDHDRRHRRQEPVRLQEHDRRETSSEEVMEYQTPAVARVTSRHPAPYQPGMMDIPGKVHSSTSRPQHHQSSLQYNISDFELSPPQSVNQYTPHHSQQTPRYNISEIEQSPPRFVRPSQRQQLDPVQYEDIEHDGQGHSRELVPYHSKYAKEGRAMNGQRQLDRMESYDSLEDDDDSGM
jgi:hypothetical protein